MKKLYKLLLSALVLVISIACSSNFLDGNIDGNNRSKIELTQEELISIAFDDPKEISDNEIVELIQDFQEVYNPQAAKTRVDNKVICEIGKRYSIQAISNVNTRSKDEIPDEVPMCEVEISDGGTPKLAVICCDERAPKILYYGDYGVSDSHTISSEIQLLLFMSQKSVLKDIERIWIIRDSLRTTTLKKLGRKLNLPPNEISYSSIKDQIKVAEPTFTRTNPTDGTLKPQQILSFVNPMCKTAWEQGTPYNFQMPRVQMLDYANKPYEGYASAGCGVVAIAQLFAVMKPTMSGLTSDGRNIAIDWAYLYKDKPTITYFYDGFPYNDPAERIQMVGSLMYRIYKDSNSKIDMKDGYATGTSTTYTNLINYVKTKFICGNESGKLFSKDKTLTSLQVDRSPVLIYGTGKVRDLNGNYLKDSHHSWLIDGFALCKHSASSSIYQQDIYWSVNMGWGTWSAKRYFMASNDVNDCEVIFSYNGDEQTVTYNTKDHNIIYSLRKK